MRRAIRALGFLALLPVCAQAQDEGYGQCAKGDLTDAIIGLVQHNEGEYFRADIPRGYTVSLFVEPGRKGYNSGSWTIVVAGGGDICVAMSGNGYTMAPSPPDRFCREYGCD